MSLSRKDGQKKKVHTSATLRVSCAESTHQSPTKRLLYIRRVFVPAVVACTAVKTHSGEVEVVVATVIFVCGAWVGFVV
jgi:hypothetical protein